MMTEMKSLDKWRDYFRRGDSDIFGIIDHAIMVAAADWPNEFKSRRGEIAELLFSCRVSRCIGCDHLELSIAGDEKAEHGVRKVEIVGVGGSGNKDSGVATDDDEDETNLNKNHIASNRIYGEVEALCDELGEEASLIVDEVMRIKDILLNKDDEPNSVLLECLRKLESMSMSVDILKDTKIGKADNGLRRHSYDKISKLAKTLFAEWKEVVGQWMNTPKEIAGAEGTPESANISVLDEEEAFPSPPHDLDIFAPEPNGFELSQILDCLDCDGNPHHSLVSQPDRTLQSSMRRKPEGTIEANDVERYNKNQQMSRDEADVRPLKHSATEFDDPGRQPKQTREQMVPTIQRKSLGSQQDKLKALDPDAKFEFAKRKLQESYRQHANAKKQRTIQVLEMIPKQSKSLKPQLKRPARR